MILARRNTHCSLLGRGNVRAHALFLLPELRRESGAEVLLLEELANVDLGVAGERDAVLVRPEQGHRAEGIRMLADRDAYATIAVKNIGVARKFYEGTLGLPLAGSGEGQAILYKSGTSKVLVYESKYAGSNLATSATWDIDDLETLVKELKAKGVTFEHYDLPGVTRQGDVHLAGILKNAWLKDPDGNILALVEAHDAMA